MFSPDIAFRQKMRPFGRFCSRGGAYDILEKLGMLADIFESGWLRLVSFIFAKFHTSFSAFWPSKTTIISPLEKWRPREFVLIAIFVLVFETISGFLRHFVYFSVLYILIWPHIWNFPRQTAEISFAFCCVFAYNFSYLCHTWKVPNLEVQLFGDIRFISASNGTNAFWRANFPHFDWKTTFQGQMSYFQNFGKGSLLTFETNFGRFQMWNQSFWTFQDQRFFDFGTFDSANFGKYSASQLMRSSLDYILCGVPSQHQRCQETIWFWANCLNLLSFGPDFLFSFFPI